MEETMTRAMRKGQEKLSELILKVSDMGETGLQEAQVSDTYCYITV